MQSYTYITTNKPNGALYTGVTSELKHRVESHKSKKYPNSFSARYNTDKLVWYKEFDSIIEARDMERRLKAGSRARKIKLIEDLNPKWRDLYEDL